MIVMRFFEILLPIYITTMMFNAGFEINTIEFWLWAFGVAFFGVIHDLAIENRIKSNAIRSK